MHWIDYLIVGLVLIGLVFVGIGLSRKSSSDTSEYLVAGRKMPWWLVGVSDVAVGLNTSSMLQDSRKVRQDGVMGLMQMWGFAMKACIQGVFFERLWRRARFKTQMEFYEARYTGWKANFARVFDTVVFGGFVTSIWAAIGLVGIKKVVTVILGLPTYVEVAGLNVSTETIAVIGVVAIALVYSAAAGARGIFWTDLIEFIIAIVPLYVLLILVYSKIGGSVGLHENIDALSGDNSKYLQFLQPFSIIIVYMFFINPLLDHGGFNPGMQRTLSLKDEREVIYSLIFKSVVGFLLRGFPFIAIGLIGMFLVSDAYLLDNFDPLMTPEGGEIPDWERVFPTLASQYLPVGLMGLMVAGFLCAFMSSFDSNIHLTGSVFVNDLYRPFIAKGKSEKHYVRATQVVMTLAALNTILIGIFVDDILYLGYFALTITLGGGWFKLLRLVWWRVNGNAEVASQLFSLVVFAFILSPFGKPFVVGLVQFMGLEGNDAFYVTRNTVAGLACTTFAFVVMLMSKPEPMDKLTEFYRRMRPFGFWGPVRSTLGGKVAAPDPISIQIALTASILAIVWGGWFAAMCFLLTYWLGGLLACCFIGLGIFGTRFFLLKLYPEGEEIMEYQELETKR
ncbi:sodium:solute symporter family transporter [Pelagicoccus mobilis]|uniref:Na+/proline symporter n=1 Tax=Pelagicoccus mobilis TaxID=415221 RepID=A0A934VRZ9_9BACT|nr:hypothetical protein [Pelagicoccus mobilis]MBK1878495.1 hypothetical protein [Pelagicoccus mobilis]